MCARFSVVPPGNPLTVAEKLTVPPPMMLPDVSRGTLKTIVAVPRAFESALLNAGTSLAALRFAVKVIGPWLLVPPDGVVGLSLPHAVTSATSATAASLFIGPFLLCIVGRYPLQAFS